MTIKLQDEDKFEYINYTQTITSVAGNNDLCIICLEDNQCKKYKISCGHVFHTTCFKKWIDTKKKLNCPYCGYIPLIIQNQFCTNCNKFGHMTSQGESCTPMSKTPKKEWKCKMCRCVLHYNTPSYKEKHYRSNKCFILQQVNIAMDHGCY